MTDLQVLAEPDALGMGYTVNVTNFTNEPVPNEPIPGNPCEGIGFDDAATEAPGGKCSIASNPQCFVGASKVAPSGGYPSKQEFIFPRNPTSIHVSA